MSEVEASLSTMQVDWQPILRGPTLHTEPLGEEHFDALFQAASDPDIWAQHPVRDRYTLPMFSVFFRTGMESRGALVVRDHATGAIIGSSRYTNYDPEQRRVEIGFTFLTRPYWGRGANTELKRLMIEHAFRFVDVVEFVVGVNNLRSRLAMEKLGGRLARTIRDLEPEGDVRESVVYEITKDWTGPNRV